MMSLKTMMTYRYLPSFFRAYWAFEFLSVMGVASSQSWAAPSIRQRQGRPDALDDRILGRDRRGDGQ
ncbi:MAG: hypothetical protein M0C28_45220 [Candidatus Moduliflexus flocculans]|nr:hypothetical protein [Candidatus Moduliflexus flocculans]